MTEFPEFFNVIKLLKFTHRNKNKPGIPLKTWRMDQWHMKGKGLLFLRNPCRVTHKCNVRGISTNRRNSHYWINAFLIPNCLFEC